MKTTTITLPEGAELCSLPNGVEDCVDSTGVIHKKIGKMVLDGTGTYGSYRGYTGEGYCYYYEDARFKIKNVTSINYKHSLCTHFKNVYANYAYNTGIGTYSDHPTLPRKYFISDKSTLAEFKAQLAELQPVLIYELAEETTQNLAETEKEKLQNLQIFNGDNQICSNAYFSASYLRDVKLNDIYENKQNADKNYTETNSKISEIKSTAESITNTVSSIQKVTDDLDGSIVSIEKDVFQLQETVNGMQTTLETQGGSNLLLNSSALFGNEHWEGVVNSLTNTDIQNNFIAKSCFILQNSTIKQIINVTNGSYYVGFKYQKLLPISNCKIKINSEEIELTELELTEIDKFINVTEHSITIEIISNTDNACLIGDIIVVQGSKQSWSSNMNEIYTSTVKIGIGLEITSNTMNTKLLANADGIRIISTITNKVSSEFTDKGMQTDELTANKAELASLLIQKKDKQTWITSLLT